MLEDEEPLPLPKIKPAVCHRKIFACSRDRRPQMRWHIIGALCGVSVVRIILGGEALEPAFQISSCGWVGILGDDQACTGVAEKNGTEAGLDIGTAHGLCERMGDLVQPTPRRLEGQRFSVHVFIHFQAVVAPPS